MDNTDKLDIELYKDNIEFLIKEYCEENNIDNLSRADQNIFNGLLMYLKRRYIKDNIPLKEIPNLYNKYNYDKVNELLDYYIELCYRNNKLITIRGFSLFSGIDEECIRNMKKPGCETLGIKQKIERNRRESCIGLLTNKNTFSGGIAILNHYDGWSQPNVTKEVIYKEKLTLEDTMRDFEQFKIEQNCQTIDEN